MKIAFFLDSHYPYNSGIWFHRNKTPSEALSTRGHVIKHFAIGRERPTGEVLNWPDVVVFGRTYPVEFNPIEDMKAYKAAGKRVLWDIDDDFWTVRKANPSVLVSSSLKDQYEGLIREADGIITPSKVLAKKIKKLCPGKPVYICPNGINYDEYRERPRTNRDGDIFIGYMAASSHFEDMLTVLDAIEKLTEKYQFYFYLYGLTAEPFEAAAYNVNKIVSLNLRPEKKEEFQQMLEVYNKIKKTRMIHTPFMPPEIHPTILSTRDFDIGIAPLSENEFNRGKSCIKFYEYAATGTVTLASDMEPYASEVNYRAKNTVEDWYNKLEKLIVDKEFRDKLQKEQSDWVMKNRSIQAIALDWELACQLPGGLKVLNQQK
jgi:glycosyltransferase involved in cell wall biosynthesis